MLAFNGDFPIKRPKGSDPLPAKRAHGLGPKIRTKYDRGEILKRIQKNREILIEKREPKSKTYRLELKSKKIRSERKGSIPEKIKPRIYLTYIGV